MGDLTPLAQYGPTGIAVGLVALVGWMVKSFMDHARDCRDDVAGAVKQNALMGERQAEATMQHTEAIKDLKRFLETKL